ncbi:MAG: carboxypeptidase-like regulatory domain-containing protein [Planctomycetota bacterium]|nr:carboxypeptidase-like regulatory domain-containing protein [Planctomycetota bacterium]MDA1113694.1 carboxypeptidase-like regulatory domain-containing protein [Planctomycetota bacterium]
MNSRFALPLLLVVLLAAGIWVLFGGSNGNDSLNDPENTTSSSTDLDPAKFANAGSSNGSQSNPERVNLGTGQGSEQDPNQASFQPQNLASFYGMVQDAQGTPLENVTIHAYGLSGWADNWNGDENLLAVHWETISDTHGFFEFPQTPRDRLRFLIEFEHPEFAKEELSNLAANIGRSFDLGAVSMGPGFEVDGTVFDAQGSPLAGALVTAYRDSQTFSFSKANQATRPIMDGVTSDAKGKFHMVGLPQRSIRLQASAQNFFAGWSSSIAGKHEEKQAGVEIQLELAAGTSGIVMDEKRNPIANARVVAGASAQSFSGREVESVETITDAQGRFSMSLPEDTEELEFTVGAQGFWVMEYNHGKKPLNDPIEISLTPIAPLTGVVVDEAGRGVAGAEVSLVENRQGKINPRDMVANVKVIADENGAFSLIPNLRNALGERFSVYAWDETHAVGSSEMFRLRSAKRYEEPDLRITVGRGFFASGSIVDPDGNPVAKARVHLRSLRKGRKTAFGQASDGIRQGDIFGQQSSAADGSFRFEGLAADDYRIEAYHVGLSPAMSPPFTLIDQDFETTLQLQRPASIVGQVEGPYQAFPNLSVSAQSAGLDPIDVRLDGKGQFRFDEVMPGTWTVQLRDGEQSGSGSSLIWGNAKPLSELKDLQVTAGSTAQANLIIDLAGRGKVSGIAQINGAPAADHFIFAVPNATENQGGGSLFGGSNAEQQMRVATCDYTGKYEIAALSGGDYWLILCKPGAFPDGINFSNTGGNEPPRGLQGQSIRVGDGNDQETNFAVFTGSLTLLISNPDSGRSTSARLIPDPADGRRNQSFFLRRKGHELHDIAAGGYLLQLRIGDEWISTHINVPSGSQAEIPVELPTQPSKEKSKKPR